MEEVRAIDKQDLENSALSNMTAQARPRARLAIRPWNHMHHVPAAQVPPL
jgi:hypothetical protein